MFPRTLLLALTISTALAAAAPVAAQEPVIGFAAPLSGPYALLGRQMLDGATAAAPGGLLIAADDACTAAGGIEAARKFIDGRAAVVAGFLCTEAIEAALPLLKDAGIPVVATGVRSGGLTDRRARTGWPVVRYAPRSDAESAAAADILAERWRDALFAVVDDGTVYSRDLAEAFRLAMETRGLKPVFVDTLRPQLDNQIGLAGRLRKAGATHVFVAADRSDTAILARDAAEIGYDVTLAGGEVLRAASDAVDLAEGTLMIALPEWSDRADPAVVAMLRERGIEPEGYVLPAYASVQVAAAAARIAASSGQTVLALLEAEEFDTALGTVGFDQRGDRTDNPYRLFRYTAGAFLELD